MLLARVVARARRAPCRRRPSRRSCGTCRSRGTGSGSRGRSAPASRTSASSGSPSCAEGVLDEAVVGGVLRRGEQRAVEPDPARLVVDLVLVALPLGISMSDVELHGVPFVTGRGGDRAHDVRSPRCDDAGRPRPSQRRSAMVSDACGSPAPSVLGPGACVGRSSRLLSRQRLASTFDRAGTVAPRQSLRLAAVPQRARCSPRRTGTAAGDRASDDGARPGVWLPRRSATSALRALGSGRRDGAGRRPATGRPDRRGDATVTPASTTKLLTTTAALATLGPVAPLRHEGGAWIRRSRTDRAGRRRRPAARRREAQARPGGRSSTRSRPTPQTLRPDGGRRWSERR